MKSDNEEKFAYNLDFVRSTQNSNYIYPSKFIIITNYIPEYLLYMNVYNISFHNLSFREYFPVSFNSYAET